MNNNGNTISQILKSSTNASVISRAHSINELTEKLRTLVTCFDSQCRVSNVCGTAMNIETSNSCLRFVLLREERALISIAKEVYPEVVEIRVRINPDLTS